MIPQELIDYIKKARKEGVREYFIREALIDSGWERKVIEEALNSEDSWPEGKRVDIVMPADEQSDYSKENAPQQKNHDKHTEMYGGMKHMATVIGILLGVLILTLAGTWALLEYKKTSYNIRLPDIDSEDSSFEYGSWPALQNANFFEQVKNSFIAQGATFIESDLSEMKIRFYENGEMKEELPIISKGREGSWWETPAGLYKVKGKEENHFSSFGNVYMPWSMPFQGNFFIHGWPYYPDGTPVAQGYSGGCIRLSDDAAKRIYELASVGTPILVFEEDFKQDAYKYQVLGSSINAENYLAADLKNNFVFAEKDASEEVSIASITKLMTALVATEYINIEKEISITNDMLVYTSIPRLKAGQSLSVFNLLYPLLMESSNEAGVAIASILGEDRFVELMNEKAKAIGMNNSTFADPNGASANNKSTAEDLFKLAKYLYNNRSFVLDISKGEARDSVYGPPVWTGLDNFNIFAEDEEFVGGKVGMTNAAGETAISIFDMKFGVETRPIVVMVLGSNDREGEVKEIVAHIRANY
ncbi:MAG: hypothetical protein COT88_02135 [Candidatus Colwellbacteria bacterium CG10_big_fil_rev_8_21_14_0_10_41_28]|uniref:L,D-TPase catalytic domain-containing protein n=1 Tax=Candidatus Colwellbacteria bacterium CG10_big_fil_rev_8_21_14_0_10_41_28 TaxID=1974539 RepID=A0A2H0VGV8_9BACT|nr:MAG: hypothetical protein COT88_02135 [Candidatus Colwellbacteria bacterium CG10_big_fil_rev_8_21_14_0_10_41_28]